MGVASENLPARAAKSRRQAAGLLRTFRAGLAHHQAGRLDRAEALYRKVLAADPDYADALHLLGVLAYQCGKPAPALQLIERAMPALSELPDDVRQSALAVLEKLHAHWGRPTAESCTAQEVAALRQLQAALHAHAPQAFGDLIRHVLMALADQS